ncbi:uncharacterized protein A1O9_05638 [Exophiala aquamarina CBS 119918]|uniref:Plastocyanin-like domain-containing protein n=1 Tax=Exophiala aquamarina CBS 119918 TaxID=1182545 RepID=A0A072PQE0_9EURO|nr:uncharacterized protein A1O9_05638 [Exophiala aquamarina CBS 119918]KEF57720.1 hypothetical protein A1O9_05638 [Exophiala aquamarina CBS 119918]
MRAIPQTACSDNDSLDNIKRIVHYNGSTTTPTTTGYSYIDTCTDEVVANLVPVISKTVNTSLWDNNELFTLGRGSDNLFRWYINGRLMDVEWESPTLLQVYNNNTNFMSSSGVIELRTPMNGHTLFSKPRCLLTPPIHLDGHDFFVLAHGTGTYDADPTTLNPNPPTTDTAMLPASSLAILAPGLCTATLDGILQKDLPFSPWNGTTKFET